MAPRGAGSLYGMLDLLILKSLSTSGPLHGVEIANHISRLSDSTFHIEEGSTRHCTVYRTMDLSIGSGSHQRRDNGPSITRSHQKERKRFRAG